MKAKKTEKEICTNCGKLPDKNIQEEILEIVESKDINKETFLIKQPELAPVFFAFIRKGRLEAIQETLAFVRDEIDKWVQQQEKKTNSIDFGTFNYKDIEELKSKFKEK